MQKSLLLWAARAAKTANELDEAADGVLVKGYESEVSEARELAKSLRGHAKAVSLAIDLEIISRSA